MTRTQIMERASHALEDEGLTHFTDTDLSDSIQDGYELVSLLCETIEKVQQVTIPIGSQTVDMTTLVSDYYRPIVIYSETNRRWLNVRTFAMIKSYGERWSNDTGNIRDWCPLGDRHLLFYPSPLAEQTLQLFYRAEPATLTDSPEWFEDCHKVLEYYICMDLLDQDLRYIESQKYFQLFMQEVDEIRLRLNKRGLQATILELSCRSIVTPISTL